MNSRAKSIVLIALAFLLSGCATGQELKGSWFLLIGRDGECRQIVHEAKTDQLETNTTWRGEKCPQPAATDPVAP